MGVKDGLSNKKKRKACEGRVSGSQEVDLISFHFIFSFYFLSYLLSYSLFILFLACKTRISDGRGHVESSRRMTSCYMGTSWLIHGCLG